MVNFYYSFSEMVHFFKGINPIHQKDTPSMDFSTFEGGSFQEGVVLVNGNGLVIRNVRFFILSIIVSNSIFVDVVQKWFASICFIQNLLCFFEGAHIIFFFIFKVFHFGF